jgi:hypothetical protein
MRLPQLTRHEHRVLTKLAVDGPVHSIARQMRGRLELYNLIDETPRGWAITPRGREALLKPPTSNPTPAAERPARYRTYRRTALL